VQLTDEILIKGCIRREADCQKGLFDRYAGILLGVSQRYARNKSDAEDILQDAFIKIFEKIGQFRNEGSLEGWMKRIVVHTALKKYSTIRNRLEFANSETIQQNEPFREPEAQNRLNEKELLAMINNLPDGYRIVFNLYVIEGFQHEEIAQMLNIQPGTSRSQLVKARLMLKKQIEIKQQHTV